MRSLELVLFNQESSKILNQSAFVRSLELVLPQSRQLQDSLHKSTIALVYPTSLVLSQQKSYKIHQKNGCYLLFKLFKPGFKVCHEDEYC